MTVKTILAASASILAAQLIGGEMKNVSYYDEDFPKRGNLEYLQERCKLDIKIPEGVKNFHTIIWFHGGGITAGNKYYPHNLIHENPNINKEGYAVVAVNYRLSGKKAQCPDYIYDAAAAVSWVLKHIKELGGDPEHVYVTGASAGAYLATLIALDPKYMAEFGTKPEQVAKYYLLTGQMTTHFQILAERRARGEKTANLVLDEYAPIQLARKNAPKMALYVGDPDKDWPARVEENQLFAAVMRRNFGDKNIKVHSLPTCAHGEVDGPALLMVHYEMMNRIWELNHK